MLKTLQISLGLALVAMAIGAGFLQVPASSLWILSLVFTYCYFDGKRVLFARSLRGETWLRSAANIGVTFGVQFILVGVLYLIGRGAASLLAGTPLADAPLADAPLVDSPGAPPSGREAAVFFAAGFLFFAARGQLIAMIKARAAAKLLALQAAADALAAVQFMPGAAHAEMAHAWVSGAESGAPSGADSGADSGAPRTNFKTADFGRIFFEGNPYPLGHRVRSFEWSARLEPSGVWFDLHLATADYDEDVDVSPDPNEKPGLSSWQSTHSWTNFHVATLSSTEWSGSESRRRGSGFIAGSSTKPLDFSKLEATSFAVDVVEGSVAPEHDDLKFGLYLLGHDSAADHQIRFRQNADRTFHVAWSGRIANSYVGDDELRYRFRAELPSVIFAGVYIPAEIDDAEAEKLFTAFVVDHSNFALTRSGEDRRYVLTGANR